MGTLSDLCLSGQNRIAEGGAGGTFEPQRTSCGLIFFHGLNKFTSPVVSRATSAVGAALGSTLGIPGAETLAGQTIGAISQLLSGNDGESLMLSIERFTMPKQSNGVITLDGPNSDRKVAGRRQVSNIEVVCKDYVDKPTAAVCWRWRNAVCDMISERIGLARDYKRTADIILFATNGAYERSYFVEGVWPTLFDPGDIDWTSNDKHTISLQLECDKVYPTGSWLNT